MDAVFALFGSPRKLTQPAPPPHDDLHKPAKTQTYSKKDRIRAKRALTRMSGGSERSERSRRSNASIPSPEGRKEVSFLSQPQIIDDDIYDATPPTQPEPESAEPPAEESESDDPEEEFKRFANHRWVDNAIEIKVEWTRGTPTWEPERNLHRDAPDALFAYWKSQGGRPTNPQDPEMFDIFAIRKHSRDRKKLMVEWVGYDESENTWLPRAVVEETAKGLVDTYWEGVKSKSKKKKR